MRTGVGVGAAVAGVVGIGVRFSGAGLAGG
jgi:hypothetical protein